MEFWWQVHCTTCPPARAYAETKREANAYRIAREEHPGHNVQVIWEGHAQ